MAKLIANSEDHDKVSHSAASDLDLHCLPITLMRGVCCLFDLGLTSLSTIFQSYCDGVWMWQGAQC